MKRSGLLVGIAGVFAGMATVMIALASVYRTPVPLVIAAPFGLTAYVMWFQGSGRLEDWITNRYRKKPFKHRHRVAANTARVGRRRQTTGGTTRSPSSSRPMSRPQAAQVLGVSPDDDSETIREAYRERAKSTHPDIPDGNRAEFKRVCDAYTVLTE